MPLRIEDYALLGDCESAALVGLDGSIDWLCWPRFDSDACFAALLGSPEEGRWLIAPAKEPTRVTRRYRGDSLILETCFENDEGAVLLVDFMLPRNGHPNLVRLVIGERGHVAMRIELVVRFAYGARVPWVHRQEDGTVRAIAGPDQVVLGGFKWSSQHLNEGGWDGHSKATITPFWTSTVAVTGTAASSGAI